MIDLTNVVIHDRAEPGPQPPTEEQWNAELTKLHWLRNHPFMPDDLAKFAAIFEGILLWTKNGRNATPPSHLLTGGLLAALQILDPDGVAHCQACGCVDEYACAHGCTWAKPGLCSKCASTVILPNP